VPDDRVSAELAAIRADVETVPAGPWTVRTEEGRDIADEAWAESWIEGPNGPVACTYMTNILEADEADDVERFVVRAQSAMPRLLAAVEATLKHHQPRPQRRYQPCEIHGGNLAVPWVRDVVESCPNCSVTDTHVCVTCRHLCPDDDCWPCLEYQHITAALLGQVAPAVTGEEGSDEQPR
jgi:hypothetical protein